MKHCAHCHGPTLQQGGLRLDSYALLMKGGKSGPVIVTGKTDKSLIIALLTGTKKPQMPMNAPPLPPTDIGRIRRWIDTGAKADSLPVIPTRVESKDTTSSRKQTHIDVDLTVQTSVPGELVPITLHKDVLPIFKANCMPCHSREKASGGLVLDSLEGVRTAQIAGIAKGGGKGGGAIIPGKSAESRFVQRIEGTVKPQMPAGENAKPLAPEIIAQIKQWIDNGAKEGSADKTKPSLDVAVKIGPLPGASALAFSNDGKWLAQGTVDKVVLWDVAAGKIDRTWTDVTGYVHTVAFSPDGKTIALGGGLPARVGTVILIDTSNGNVAAKLEGHRDVVYDLAYNSDGTRLITASLDKTARVWDSASGKAIYEIKDHSDVVYACAFAPDGSFYTASADRTVRHFDGKTGKSIRSFVGHSLPVRALAVSPNGKNVISAGEEPALRWWNPEDGKTVRNEGGHSDECYEICFSKDGTLIASAGADMTVRIWNGSSGGAIRSLDGATDWVYSVAISPDNKLVAGGTSEGQVLIWDQASGRLLATLVTPPEKQSRDWLAITPQGYFDASPELLKLISFKVAGEVINPVPFLTALHKPDQVAKSLKGDQLESPSIKP